MTDLRSDLLSCLEPAERPQSAGGAASLTAFEGRNQRLDYHRLFGGQLLAQFVQAASLTCPGKAVKSLHVLFPRSPSATRWSGITKAASSRP